MHPQFNQKQLEHYQRVVDFASRNLSQCADQFDRDKWQQCARFGVLGWFVPKQYGGEGLSVVSTIYALEALGYGCPDNALTLALNGQMWSVQEPILKFGSSEQKNEFLPKLCSGELIATHAMTELESGSDSFNLATTAKPVDGGYILNGRKSYLGLAPVADLALVFANTNPDAGQWGISAFLVDTHSEGVTLSAPIEKMGLKSNPLGEIELADCFVDSSRRLGPEGVGVSLFTQSMDWERGFVFASHVGSMARQLDQCVEYSRNRKQFKQPISKFQAVSHRIAEMKSRLEISRLLVNNVARLKDQGQPAVLEAAMAKLYVSEAFVSNSMDAIRIHGALGYLTDYQVERDLRDATAGVIYSGTSDIQRNIIASQLGL